MDRAKSSEFRDWYRQSKSLLLQSAAALSELVVDFDGYAVLVVRFDPKLRFPARVYAQVHLLGHLADAGILSVQQSDQETLLG